MWPQPIMAVALVLAALAAPPSGLAAERHHTGVIADYGCPSFSITAGESYADGSADSFRTGDCWFEIASHSASASAASVLPRISSAWLPADISSGDPMYRPPPRPAHC